MYLIFEVIRKPKENFPKVQNLGKATIDQHAPKIII